MIYTGGLSMHVIRELNVTERCRLLLRIASGKVFSNNSETSCLKRLIACGSPRRLLCNASLCLLTTFTETLSLLERSRRPGLCMSRNVNIKTSLQFADTSLQPCAVSLDSVDVLQFTWLIEQISDNVSFDNFDVLCSICEGGWSPWLHLLSIAC